MNKLVNIEDSRYRVLEHEFQSDYFWSLIHTIKEDKQKEISIYPQGKDIFRAFELSKRDSTKVIILWQDPYHGFGQAHGLSFSVPTGIQCPPSLINIYKEIDSDLWTHSHTNYLQWDLSHRAQQGVLLLNAFLTVQANAPLSHSSIGREHFTDKVINILSEQKEGLVFMLRWNFAKSKAKLIDNQKHLVLIANHPSPLSANRWWWFGCKHFSQCNEYLEKHGKKAIVW